MGYLSDQGTKIDDAIASAIAASLASLPNCVLSTPVQRMGARMG